MHVRIVSLVGIEREREKIRRFVVNVVGETAGRFNPRDIITTISKKVAKYVYTKYVYL